MSRFEYNLHRNNDDVHTIMIYITRHCLYMCKRREIRLFFWAMKLQGSWYSMVVRFRRRANLASPVINVFQLIHVHTNLYDINECRDVPEWSERKIVPRSIYSDDTSTAVTSNCLNNRSIRQLQCERCYIKFDRDFRTFSSYRVLFLTLRLIRT